MDRKVDPKVQVKDELIAMGLKPMTWAEASAVAKEKLEPADRAVFHRHHNNFTSYLSTDTLNRFYGFVFSRAIHLEINNFRFHRLEGVLEALLPRLTAEDTVLDVGAGAGIVASMVLKHVGPKAYAAQDPCREVRDYLQSMGFTVLPHPLPSGAPARRFTRILCVDSLGELNSDEDGAAMQAEKPLLERVHLIEQAYGYGQKLETWKPYLEKGGKVLLWEPIRHRQAWDAIIGHFAEYGWMAQFHGDQPRNSYLELTLP